MKKLFLIASIGFMSATSLVACSLKDDYIETCNPYKVAYSDSCGSEEVRYKNESFSYSHYDMPIRNIIEDIHDFRYVTQNTTQNKNSFEYIAKHTAPLGAGARYRMTFYDDGYVDVDMTSNSKSKDHYYYRFDTEKATMLFNFIEHNYQERAQVA